MSCAPQKTERSSTAEIDEIVTRMDMGENLAVAQQVNGVLDVLMQCHSKPL
jgi:hypothetical protein